MGQLGAPGTRRMGHLRGSCQRGLWSPRHGDQGAPISARRRRREVLKATLRHEVVHSPPWRTGIKRVEATFFVELASDTSLRLALIERFY